MDVEYRPVILKKKMKQLDKSKLLLTMIEIIRSIGERSGDLTHIELEISRIRNNKLEIERELGEIRNINDITENDPNDTEKRA